AAARQGAQPASVGALVWPVFWTCRLPTRILRASVRHTGEISEDHWRSCGVMTWTFFPTSDHLGSAARRPAGPAPAAPPPPPARPAAASPRRRGTPTPRPRERPGRGPRARPGWRG